MATDVNQKFINRIMWISQVHDSQHLSSRINKIKKWFVALNNTISTACLGYDLF